MPLDPTVIAEFEAHVGRWLADIAAGRFTPRPHPLNGRCSMCCVDSLGIEDLAERARLFDPVSVADDDAEAEASTVIELPPWVEASPGESLAVSAGAGSGKTTSLVGRVAALINSPACSSSELVVITFTEKAAREVSHRLRTTLGDTVPLDDAFIGTIHGFCQSLLRRFPIEAGLPPKFTTADELTSGAMADDRAEQAVQTLYNAALKNQTIEEALVVVASFGAMQFLSELVRAIDNDWLLFAESVPDPPMSIAVAQSTVMRMLDAIATDPRYVAASATMRARLDAAVDDATATLEFVQTVPALAAAAWALNERRHGTSPAWVPFRQAMRLACFEPALSRLMAALTPIVVESARDRVARGELSFDDLLVLTRRLLRTHPEVRRAVRARHRYLFVDEFQDTDQVQFDILTELTRPTVRARRRRCSPSATRSNRSTASATPTSGCSPACSLPTAPTIELTVNRRTRADVCAWINAVLVPPLRAAPTSIDDGGGTGAVRRARIHNDRPTRADDGPGVVVLGMPGATKIEHDDGRRHRSRRGRRHRRRRAAGGWRAAAVDGHRRRGRSRPRR